MPSCNVIAQDRGAGRVEITAINRLVATEKVGNPTVTFIATQVAGKLEGVIAGLYCSVGARRLQGALPRANLGVK